MGQTPIDTTLSISVVEITSTKIRKQATGNTSQRWTASELEKLPANNLAEFLSAETGSYIKSYGQGSLATSSIRGGSAGHTLVLWNGLPIQSPMLGLLDLALLPVQAMESIEFSRGGNAALWGSGAIGGVLNLENQSNFSKNLTVKNRSVFGSFGQFQQQLNIGFGNHKIQSITRLSHQKAANDFYYFLADGLPERQQTNARLSQQFLMQDLYWKWNDRSYLELHFWQQQSDRQIPPTNVQNRSEAHQDDTATRLILNWKQITNKGLWQIKMGFFNEHLNYFDDLILLESRSRFRTYLAEITGQWTWNQHQLFIGNTHTQTHAWSPGYQDNIPSEYKGALFASWKYNGKKLKTQLSLRQELVETQLVPLIPAFGFDFYVHPSLIIKGKISRNYRLPTFNDRFWLPGGNPDLLPESGWSQELTVEQKIKKAGWHIQASLTVFNRKIDHWILWSIREGQSFWSANNITKVWSRGLEPRFTSTYLLKNLQFQFRAGYDYIRSTNQVALDNPKMAAGDQLIYTPVHQAFGKFSVEWKGWHFAYQHHITGAARGINDPLDAYQVGSLRLQYAKTLSKYRGILFFNLNNIWNQDYLVVERRPMPGTHFQIGINLEFKGVRKR
jgi:iron complex outermembrane receptor protein